MTSTCPGTVGEPLLSAGYATSAFLNSKTNPSLALPETCNGITCNRITTPPAESEAFLSGSTGMGAAISHTTCTNQAQRRRPLVHASAFGDGPRLILDLVIM